ncbi:MAG: right-handed parallel beta-helix repeat-containing protein, partial [Planctomycetes bacterium]|nr:right-handed parallel beta-helix repeat-containing protein [Planctomycetota bacterium]
MRCFTAFTGMMLCIALAASGALAADRFEDNDSRIAAADIGVGPGVHLNNLTIEAADDDWYQFELLAQDHLDVTIQFVHAAGNLDLEITNSAGILADSATSEDDDETVALSDLPAGTYYAHVFGVAGAANGYTLAIEPGAGSLTRLFYVNDADTTDDLYTLAIGNDANPGTAPDAPKATVQSVLDDHVVGPADLVLVDTGTYTGAVLITVTDEGGNYAGSPAGSIFDGGGTHFELVDADYNLIYGFTFSGSGTAIYARDDGVDSSTNNVFRANIFAGTHTGIRINYGESDTIEYNLISGPGTRGVYMPYGGSVTIRRNTIFGLTYGVYGSADFDGVIQDNTISVCDYGVDVAGGIAAVSGNELFECGTGLFSNTPGTTAYDNDVHHNITGVEGYGTFGGADWSAGQPNDIHHNTTGVIAYNNAIVRFNRIHHNSTGLSCRSSVTVDHNLIYRNTARGVLVSASSGTTIENNTVYADSGDCIRIQNGAQDISLTNNILWTTDGYDVWVDTDSQVGFSSDYNNLFASDTGRVIWWQRTFSDLFDWQVEADFDRNSIGYTAVNPVLDDPLFVNLAADDYHLTDVLSTSIDAGDPTSILTQEPAPDGDRINLGAYGNTPQAALSPPAYIEVDFPNYYTDWEADVGAAIIWHTYNVSGNVNIKLYQEGVGEIADVATVAAADGSYGWSPDASGVIGNVANRYRIRIISADAPAVFDDSREPFAVPPSGDDYYVDDDDNTNDEYTPGAVGNNRNTGKTTGDPKANLLPVLRSYDLGPGQVVHIDTGNYIHVRNVLLSGNLDLNNDEGATFTGPTDTARVATIDRANTNADTANVELNDADYVTLANLTLVGAEMGVWVHNGSTNFTGTLLTVANNTEDGIRVESDAEASTLHRLNAHDNGRYGIHVTTPILRLSGCTAYNNNTGIYVRHDGDSTTVVGSADETGATDLAFELGNKVYNNSRYGIQARSNVLVFGNTVYGHSATSAEGIRLEGNASATHNVVHGNYKGIITYLSASLITDNRVYNNAHTGISAGSNSPLLRNVVYSNPTGIELRSNYTATAVANNLVYANWSHSILVQSRYGPQIVNNTIYQTAGNGVRLQNQAKGIYLRNNIFRVDGGCAISVADNSQVDFASDYNLFYAPGAGLVGFWQGMSLSTLAAWRSATFTDNNSIDQDPRFVNAQGPGGVLGYSDATDDGRDDDLHLQSTEGSFHGGALAPVIKAATGLPVMPVM